MHQRLDVRGVALLAATLLAAMLGIASIGSRDLSSYTDPRFLIPECAGRRGAHRIRPARGARRVPVHPARYLVGQGFGVMNLVNFLYGCAALGFGALVPLYAQERYSIPALGAGTLLTARAVGMISAAGLAVYFLRRTGYRWPMRVGFSLTAVGLVVLATSPAYLSPYIWLTMATGVTGLGMGDLDPGRQQRDPAAGPNETAAIAGLRGMFRQCGAITAVSVTAAIMARSAHPGIAQAHVFLIFAAILVGVLPLLLFVPEHRGAW